MPNPLDDYDKEEADLLKRIEEIRRRKQLAEEALKNSIKPLLLTVNEVLGKSYVRTRVNEARADFIAVCSRIAERTYVEQQRVNNIPLLYWNDFLTRVQALPEVTITYDLGVEDEIKAITEGPRFFVDIKDGKFTIQCTVFAKNKWKLYNIPSAHQKHNQSFWTVSMSEAHLVAEALKDEHVEYTENASTFIEERVRIRALIDVIATKEDTDLVLDLNGNSLRNFQKVGVEFINAVDGNGIIADEMGLGKTPQGIGACVFNNWRTLVICPASLKTNWYREIYKFTGKQATVLFGSIPDEYDIVKLIVDKPTWTIVNYDMISKNVDIMDDKTKEKVKKWPWIDLINIAGFDAILIDEAHYIKNVGSLRSQASRMLKAPHIMPLTGTPLMNRPSELWPLLTMVAPNQFPSYEQFTLRYTHDGKEARNVEELKNLLKSYMIRRLKRDVIKELPPINRIYETHDMSDEAMRKYKKVLQGIYEVLATYKPGHAGEEWKVTSILTEIMRLKQICSDDKLDRASEMAIELYDSADVDDPNRKVIIFSQFEGAVKEIAKRLGHEAVYFTGSNPMHERTKLQDEFQNNDKVKFLVTTMRVAGEGLNLTRAGSVIFVDLGWTPAIHEQAEARAYGRLSNLHSINSYYLIASNTIEDWIQELLAMKMRIITEVVEGVKEVRDSDSSIANEIIKRLKDQMGRG